MSEHWTSINLQQLGRPLDELSISGNCQEVSISFSEIIKVKVIQIR